MKTRYLILCPACDRLTQHRQKHPKRDEQDEFSHYYLCTLCLRTRRIGEEELEELLYTASRHVQTFLEREAI